MPGESSVWVCCIKWRPRAGIHASTQLPEYTLGTY